MNLNRVCKEIKEENQNDITTMRFYYERIKSVNDKVSIDGLNAKKEFLAFMDVYGKKLRSYS